MEKFLVLVFVLPLIAGFVSYIAGLKGNHLSKIFTAIVLLTNLVLSYKIFKYVMASADNRIIAVFSGWMPPLGINFYADSIAVIFLLFANLLAFASLFSAKLSYSNRFHGLILLLTAALNGLILSGDIFNIFVFFEILCLVSFALVAYYRKAESIEASVKYFVLGSIASAMLLIGIALIYAKTGTLNLAQIADMAPQWSGLFKAVVFGLLLVGFGVEAGIFPMNAWLFDAHPAAPYPVSALLSGIVIEVALYLFLRIKSLFFVDPLFSLVLLLLGLVTFAVSELVGFYQRDVKRLLAYSSAGQIGLMLMAFSLPTKIGMFAGLLLFINHLLAKGLLFISVGSMSDRSGDRDIDRFSESASFVDKVAVLAGGLSLLGVPPSIGFMGKVLLFIALVKAGFLAFALCLIPFVVLEALYVMRLVGRTLASSGDGRIECPGQVVVQWVFTFIIIVLPIIVSRMSIQTDKLNLNGFNKQDYLYGMASQLLKGDRL